MFNLVHYVTEENTEERKCETRTVGLLSSQREVHFYLSRNKDKSETRTNDIRDRSFQLKRSARQVCAFVPQTPSQGPVQCMRLWRGPLKFRLSTRFT